MNRGVGFGLKQRAYRKDGKEDTPVRGLCYVGSIARRPGVGDHARKTDCETACLVGETGEDETRPIGS